MEVQLKLLLNQSAFANVRRKLICVGCGHCRFAQEVIFCSNVGSRAKHFQFRTVIDEVRGKSGWFFTLFFNRLP